MANNLPLGLAAKSILIVSCKLRTRLTGLVKNYISGANLSTEKYIISVKASAFFIAINYASFPPQVSA